MEAEGSLPCYQERSIMKLCVTLRNKAFFTVKICYNLATKVINQGTLL